MRANQRRASHTIQQQVGGNLAGGIAYEKEAGAKAVDRRAEMQIAVHLQSSKADVHTVHVGDAVAESNQRDQPPTGFAQRGAAQRFVLEQRRVGSRHGLDEGHSAP